jgi:hypothetical protein
MSLPLPQDAEAAVARRFTIDAHVAIGATGAPTLKKFNHTTGVYGDAGTTGWLGVKSISRTGTGAYTITLSGPAQRLLGLRADFTSASGAAAAPIVGILDATDVRSNSAPVIRILCQSAAGVAGDPASGELMHLVIELGLARQ